MVFDFISSDFLRSYFVRRRNVKKERAQDAA